MYDRFATTGRILALACDPNSGVRPHHFWDSDIAKWIESAAYILQKEENPDLMRLADQIIDVIAAHQEECGYYNSYYLTVAPSERFKNRKMHELYCAGHLIEAAVAYKRATGKDKLYQCMCRYADYIDRVFRQEQSAVFLTPGHQEIELALYRLYRESGEKKYLELAQFFLEKRGGEKERILIDEHELRDGYAQDDLPIRQQTTARGHAVRLLYMYAAVADIALETGDAGLAKTCEAVFRDIVSKKMYITGGIGQNCNNEGFDEPYYLPPDLAYNETCASIAMCYFAKRMQLLSDHSAYADIIELELYNGALSGLSLDGKAFFYENPLEIHLDSLKRITGKKQTLHRPDVQRKELFECSCCPPNITRYILSVADYLYTVDNGTIRVNQYMDSDAKFGQYRLVQKTDYPRDGSVKFNFFGKATRVGFRIPGWCDRWSALVNGFEAKGELHNGYLYLILSDGDYVMLDFDLRMRAYESDPRVRQSAGKVAFARGPVIYCAEAADNAGILLHDFRALPNQAAVAEDAIDYLPSAEVAGVAYKLPTDGALYSSDAYEEIPCRLKLIPYAYFANRGESDMVVWILKKS